MERITRNEIESAIESFVNSIYDEGEESGWMSASYDEWIKAVYLDLVTWKSIQTGTAASTYRSNENRFDGKDEIIKRIKPILRRRLKELKADGYLIQTI